MNIIERLISPESNLSFNQRIYLPSFFSALAISLAMVFITVKFDFDESLLVLSIISTVFIFFLLVLTILGKKLSLLKLAFVSGFPIITSISWFYEEGIYGSVPALILINSLISVLIFEKNRVAVSVFFTAQFLILTGIQNSWPKLILAYPSHEAKFASMLTTYSFVGILTAFLLIIVRNNYDKALKEMLEKQKIIDEKHKESQVLNGKLESMVVQKDKLLSIISHDSRGPIRNVGLMLEMMKDGDIGIDDFKKMLPLLEEHIKETSNFMDNMLYWVKSQQGALVPNLKQVEVQTLFENIINLYKAQAQEKAVYLELNNLLPKEVLVDENMLSIIVRNLVNNALKFTQSGGTVAVNTKLLEGNLLISVKDNGVGMTQERINILFKEISGETNNRDLSNGLGLKLVNEFVVINKGHFEINSQLGVGSEFTVTIPTQE